MENRKWEKRSIPWSCKKQSVEDWASYLPMQSHSSAYQIGAVLLSVALLAGSVLPGIQQLCAEETPASPPALQAEAGPMHHSAHASHRDAHASGHGHANGHATDCTTDCTDVLCCESPSALTDIVDLRLPVQPATVGTEHLRSDGSVSLPALESEENVWDIDVGPLSSTAVRLHVWTATFQC